jgi:hypothetical protein
MGAVETSLAEGVKQMTEDTFKREAVHLPPTLGPLDRPKAVPVNEIKELLNERGKTHGNYTDHARTTQRLKGIVAIEIMARAQRGQPELSYEALESIEMILHKIGRIIAGDANFQDHWDDIAGYAKLANGDR